MKSNNAPDAASFEADSFQLLRELQRSLDDVLKSLPGKPSTGLFQNYLFYSSIRISHAAEGFIVLRGNRRVDASKLLVRPAIELMFRQQAVLKQPGLLYRMAYSETMNDRKWLRLAYTKASKDYDSVEQRQWQEFSRKYTEQHPKHAREDKQVSLYEIAKAANLDGYYNSHYRLYCQFTHACTRAMVGILNFSDSEDNRTVATCVLGALEALNSGVGAGVKGLADLRERLFDRPEPSP